MFGRTARLIAALCLFGQGLAFGQISYNYFSDLYGNVKLGLRMRKAFECRGLRDSDYYEPLVRKGTKLYDKGYGCYCGPGNAGLGKQPVDAIDECCARHDYEWWYIWERELQPKCDCYKADFNVRCDAAGNVRCEQPIAGASPDKLICQRLCCEEMNRLTGCLVDALRRDGYHGQYFQPWGKRAAQPYCQATGYPSPPDVINFP